MAFGKSNQFRGVSGVEYQGTLDAFHGETHLAVDEPVQERLQRIYTR